MKWKSTSAGARILGPIAKEVPFILLLFNPGLMGCFTLPLQKGFTRELVFHKRVAGWETHVVYARKKPTERGSGGANIACVKLRFQ